MTVAPLLMTIRLLALSSPIPESRGEALQNLHATDDQAQADWAFALHSGLQYAHQHVVTNHSCELDGDVAHTETYWMFAGMHHDGNMLSLGGGRYIDRFEKRDGQWKIAARKCVPDWGGVPGPSWLSAEGAMALASGGRIARDRSDSSYERPLEINPDRIGYIFQT